MSIYQYEKENINIYIFFKGNKYHLLENKSSKRYVILLWKIKDTSHHS